MAISIVNKREINKRIYATLDGDPAHKQGYRIIHNMPDEAIVCYTPTLELAGCIVKALRARAYVKLAEQLLTKHMEKKHD